MDNKCTQVGSSVCSISDNDTILKRNLKMFSKKQSLLSFKLKMVTDVTLGQWWRQYSWNRCVSAQGDSVCGGDTKCSKNTIIIN